MPTKPQFPLRIFFDGACSVCAAEVEQYRRKDRKGLLIPVDISAPDFDPALWGIAREEFMYQLHAIDQAGTVYRGVDAFRAVWLAFPARSLPGLMAVLIALPLVNPVARLCYRGFARIREYLPKRGNACESGSCGLGKGHQR